jgi:alpha-1,3-rhamnosyl/mannosyltransferase
MAEMAPGAGAWGIGATALARGLRRDAQGGLDGIGVYTQHLLDGLRSTAHASRIQPVVLEPEAPTLPGHPWTTSTSYRWGALWSTATGLAYPGTGRWRERLSLFHATDHYIPKLRGVPVIANVMDVIALRHPQWLRQKMTAKLAVAIFAKAIRHADHIVTISDFSAQDIHDVLGIPSSRITAIPLGVDPSLGHPPDKAFAEQVLNGWSLQPGFFLVVGTLQPRKNLLRVMQAHDRLPHDARHEHPLVIVGRPGWRCEDELQAIQQRESLGTARWLKHVPQDALHVLLHRSLALVFASLYEGFGLPVVEAFAAGLPVIASSTTSIPEVAGRAALLIDPTRTDEIAQAMQSMIDNPGLRAQLKAMGLQRAASFEWSRTVADTLRIYSRFADVAH